MSEEHARLFVLTVPGNGSSSTLGSNAARRSDEQQTDPVREVGHGRERASSTPEDEDLNGSRLNADGNQPSAENDENPGINDLDKSNQRDRANLEDESIEYMDDVVNQ